MFVKLKMKSSDIAQQAEAALKQRPTAPMGQKLKFIDGCVSRICHGPVEIMQVARQIGVSSQWAVA